MQFMHIEWEGSSPGRYSPRTRSNAWFGLTCCQTYKPNPDSEELAYDLHFWIGANSTQVVACFCFAYEYVGRRLRQVMSIA